MPAAIFDQLRADSPDAPVCPICGHADLMVGFRDTICVDCWMQNRDDPEQAARWHCADCGEFMEGLERHQIVVSTEMQRYEAGATDDDRLRYELVFVCREHYEARTVVAA